MFRLDIRNVVRVVCSFDLEFEEIFNRNAIKRRSALHDTRYWLWRGKFRGNCQKISQSGYLRFEPRQRYRSFRFKRFDVTFHRNIMDVSVMIILGLIHGEIVSLNYKNVDWNFFSLCWGKYNIILYYAPCGVCDGVRF